MNQMKKSYIKPALCSEAFVPNEYVAVCATTGGAKSYSMACEVNSSDHSTTDGCRVPDAFTITIDADGNIVSIYERGNNSGNWNGGEVDNIEIVTKTENEYKLKWTTRVGKWGFYYNMQHEGTLNIKTAPLVKNIS